MKSRSILLILLGIALFTSLGCVAENTYSPTKKEVLVSEDTTDLDGDGLWDYAVYEFSTTNAENSVKVTRRLSAVAITSSEYTTFNSLTDLNLLEADDYLDDFGIEKRQSEDACAGNIGLISVNCIDVKSCAGLCAAHSVSCKRLAAEYQEVLGGSMIYFVQDNNYIDTSLYEARNTVLNLRTGTEGDKNVYLENLREIIGKVASLNANPLYYHPKIDLCQNDDFGVDNLVMASGIIGDYETEVIGYTYIMTVDIEPILEEGLANELSGIAVDDSIPLSAIPDPNALSSHQSISTAVQGDDLMIKWSSSKVSDIGYILYYKFDSETPPEEFIDELMAPSVTIKTLDLSALGPTNALFMMFLGIMGNYYIALGAAVGVTIAFLMFIYTIVVLAISLISARIAERRMAYGLKRAFGKTRVRWKIDGVAAVILLAVGFYLAIYLAPEPFTVLTLLTSLEYLLSEPVAFTATSLVLLGFVMAYSAIENLIKIILLERIYGVTVREERSAYLSDIKRLKERMELLKKLVKQYAAEEFEVSEEYDVLASISAEKVRDFERKMTSYSRAMLDEYLDKVDSAIEKLEEKKKLADTSWPEWSENISKMLSEHNEVHASSLVTVPSSLRNWALSKYVKESREEGIIFEGNVIRRRRISPEALIKEMVADGFLKGGIIFKKDNVIAAWFEKGRSPTLATALLFKLKSYLNSLNKVIELGDLMSFVSVGDDIVLVVMKNASYDTALFVNKEKFKEAIEVWKKKVKMLSET